MDKPKTPPVDTDEDVEAADFFGVDASKVPEETRLHPILTNEQVELARRRALDKIQKEREKAAMADVEAKETERLKREEGLTTGIGVEDELVHVIIDVPEWVPWIAVNGQPYWAGFSYQVPRHLQRTMQEQMQNAWRTHDLADGKSIAQQFQSRRQTTINGETGAIHNAPVRANVA